MKKLFFLLLLVAGQVAAQQPKDFLLDKGIAIYGYDPVTYFTGKPKKGQANVTASYQGVTYRFVSSSNAELFKKNAEKYEPEYGGWCAYAMGAKGEKVDIDPENYKIVNGKLNLFYKNFFNNTLDDWNKDEKNLKVKADKNWVKYINSPK